MTKRTVLAATLALLSVVSCKEKKESAPLPGAGGGPAPAIEVEAMVVKTSTINEIVEASGTILANEATEIRPEISGRITQLNIREGAVVPKGSLLVKIFDGDLQAQLKKLQVQLAIAEKSEERQKELLKIGGIAQQDYDLSVLQISNIKADIELTRVSIGKTEIRAPYTGKLGLKAISPGAYVSPSTLVTTITEVNQMKIEFSVPEKYSSQIRNGLELDFTTEGSDRTYKAAILARESSVDENTRNLKIRAVVKSPDGYLVPGSFAKVRMILGENNQAVMIPSNAVIPQARNKQVAVYRNGEVDMVQITTGVRDSSNIQVVTGLTAGDTLVTTGLLFVKPKAKLKLTKIVN